MYRIVKKTAVVTTNGGGKPDVEWETQVYGEYFNKAVAEQALEDLNIPKYNVEIELFQSLEELINTDYFD